MRIAIVRQRYNPYGGAERFIERAIPALERAGVELTLVGRSRGNWPAQRFIAADPFFAGNVWRDWSFARAARRRWREARFDLVQSHERIPGCEVYRAGDGVHAAWLSVRRAKAGPLERLGLALNPYHRYVCAAERRMFLDPALRAVICNSRMVRDEIVDAFGLAQEKLHVIYNGVDLEHFHPRQRAGLRAGARAELGLGTGEVAFLFVGSGFARKGLDAAIRAMAACEGNSMVLLVAGTDRRAARYAALAGELGVAGRVRLLGGRSDVRPLYAAADCFILPTRYDPFPSSALEALAMGLPAIVGRRSGAAEVVSDGESGWVCDPEDPATMARQMREAAALAAQPAATDAARSTAERYGIEDMARKLTELYAALLAPARV